MGAVAVKPFRVLDSEGLLRGQELTPDLINKAALLAKDAARPITDIRATADYRFDLVEALVRKGLSQTYMNLRAV